VQEFVVQTGSHTDFVDITAKVSRAAGQIGIEDGAVIVFVPHTTAAVTINEGADPDVVRDMDMELHKIVPHEDGYRHAEGNSDAHIKTTLVGSSVHVLVAGGKLQLGTWQKVWFCEFDGPRRRRVWIQSFPCS
jgi:secondary thiamine-phosphate synthase enzyme